MLNILHTKCSPFSNSKKNSYLVLKLCKTQGKKLRSLLIPLPPLVNGISTSSLPRPWQNPWYIHRRKIRGAPPTAAEAKFLKVDGSQHPHF